MGAQQDIDALLWHAVILVPPCGRRISHCTFPRRNSRARCFAALSMTVTGRSPRLRRVNVLLLTVPLHRCRGDVVTSRTAGFPLCMLRMTAPSRFSTGRVIGALFGEGGPAASCLWLLTLSLLFCCSFHSRHQISEPLPLLPFTFVLWFGLGASDPPGELTRERAFRVGSWIKERVVLE